MNYGMELGFNALEMALFLRFDKVPLDYRLRCARSTRMFLLGYGRY
jgi:hypothetical protein